MQDHAVWQFGGAAIQNGIAYFTPTGMQASNTLASGALALFASVCLCNPVRHAPELQLVRWRALQGNDERRLAHCWQHTL